MITIRNNTFETNSSSTHSIVIAKESVYNDWVSGVLYYNNFCFKKNIGEYGNKEFLSRSELQKIYEEYLPDYENPFTECGDEAEIDERLAEDCFYPFDYWHDDLEQEEHEYVTESGERIKIRCAYGYD